MRRICHVLDLPRSTYYRKAKLPVKSKPVVDEQIALHIKAIITDPKYPGYGYRRTLAVLRFDLKIPIGKNKVQRIMQIKGWQAKPIKRPQRYGGQPYDSRQIVVDPNETIAVSQPDTRWCTDLTRFYTQADGLINLIPVIDCFNSECVGYRVSYRGRSIEAEEALQDAVLNSYKDVRSVPKGLRLRTDNGSIFLAKSYWDELKRLGIEPEYTPYSCPQANGIAERFMRTIKEECIWQHRFNTLQEAELVISEWIKFYNNQRRHSRLGYLTPVQYRESLRKNAA